MKAAKIASLIGALIVVVLLVRAFFWFRESKAKVMLNGVPRGEARVYHHGDEYLVQPSSGGAVCYLIRPSQKVVGIPSNPILLNLGFALVARHTRLEIVDLKSPKNDDGNVRVTFAPERIEFTDIEGHLILVKFKN